MPVGLSSALSNDMASRSEVRVTDNRDADGSGIAEKVAAKIADDSGITQDGEFDQSSSSDGETSIPVLSRQEAIQTLIVHSNLNELMRRYNLNQDMLKPHVSGRLIHITNVTIPLNRMYTFGRFKQARAEIQNTINVKIKGTRGVKNLIFVGTTQNFCLT